MCIRRSVVVFYENLSTTTAAPPDRLVASVGSLQILPRRNNTTLFLYYVYPCF